MHPTPDVVIVGGGIIGSASAYTLAEAGLRVHVVERDCIGAHASGGAAGILSTRDDEPGTPIDSLNRASLALHPRYAEKLREETRIDVEYQQAGTLALTGDGEPPVIPAHGARYVDRPEMLEMEPCLGETWQGAIFYECDGQVNAGRLTQALAEGAARKGATFSQGCTATGFLTDRNGVRGIRTSDGDVPAAWTLIAGGPWSGLLATSLGISIPVRPVKGQIIWATPRPAILNRPIFAGCYLVPKPEAGIAIGATYEDAGFNETPTIGGMRELAALATEALPALRDAPFSRAWSSIRPVTSDGLPILGPVVSHPGLLIATGHGAYGIALSLITAELARSWVLGTTEPVDSHAFRLEGREDRVL
jgi:glycine oxidase